MTPWFYDKTMLAFRSHNIHVAAANPGLTTEEFPVPDNMVGLIIGRGGDQITKIQADTGCRVAVVPQPTGSATRPCTVNREKKIIF